MTNTKEEVYESVYFDGYDAREEGFPRWCNTYERKLNQIWKSGWDKKNKELGEKNEEN